MLSKRLIAITPSAPSLRSFARPPKRATVPVNLFVRAVKLSLSTLVKPLFH